MPLPACSLVEQEVEPLVFAWNGWRRGMGEERGMQVPRLRELVLKGSTVTGVSAFDRVMYN